MLNALNSKDETKEALIYRVLEEIFKMTPKINFYKAMSQQTVDK